MAATWIPSAEAFGTPQEVLILGAAGIASGEAFGTATVLNTSIITVVPTSIPSGEAFGTPFIAKVLGPSGIVSQEAFGTPVVNTTYTLILCSATAHGQGQLLIGQISLAGTAIGTGILTDPAVVIHWMSGFVLGSGQLLWNGPAVIYGTGTLTGLMQVLRVPAPICPIAAPAQSFSYMQALGKGGLTLCITDCSGNIFSPAIVTYSLYEVLPGGYKQLRGPACRTPVMDVHGCYYATGMAGECGQPGNWCIVWSWSQGPGCPGGTSSEPFRVLDAAMSNPCDPNRKQKYGWGC